MGARTGIDWTDHTFNPWWGCRKVSPACDHCYAERDAARFGFSCFAGQPYRTFGEHHWAEPRRWNVAARKAGETRRVFCASMCDVYDCSQTITHVLRASLWNAIMATPHLQWMILTKRPHAIRDLTPPHILERIWLGVTAEDQERADERVPILLDVGRSARVRFVSAEPLLGPIDLRDWVDDTGLPGLDWVIAGCESGPKARPTDADWFRSLRDRCEGAEVPFFLKQSRVVGDRLVKLPKLDGRQWAQVPKVSP